MASMKDGKRKFINNVHIEGWLYQHKLEEKVSGPNSKNPGTHFVQGDIEIATDNAKTNIITVHYSYVTPTFGSSGKENPAYKLLCDVIAGKYCSIMGDGAEKASMFRIDSSIGLNEFMAEREGKEVVVSVKRNDGGFIHAIDRLNEDENSRCTFDCDMLITNVKHIEPNEEKGYPEKAVVSGYVFNYNGAILPVDFSVPDSIPGAIAYFEGLEASTKNPTFTQVKGREISEIVKTVKEEPSAFGKPIVKTYENTRKDFIIVWAKEFPYEYGEDGIIDGAYMRQATADRELYLATVKKNHDDYVASKKKGSSAFGGSNAEVKDEDYGF